MKEREMKDVCKKLKGDGEDMKSETTASETSVSETVHEGRSAVEEEQLVFVEGRRKKSEKERDFSGLIIHSRRRERMSFASHLLISWSFFGWTLGVRMTQLLLQVLKGSDSGMRSRRMFTRRPCCSSG